LEEIQHICPWDVKEVNIGLIPIIGEALNQAKVYSEILHEVYRCFELIGSELSLPYLKNRLIRKISGEISLEPKESVDYHFLSALGCSGNISIIPMLEDYRAMIFEYQTQINRINKIISWLIIKEEFEIESNKTIDIIRAIPYLDVIIVIERSQLQSVWEIYEGYNHATVLFSKTYTGPKYQVWIPGYGGAEYSAIAAVHTALSRINNIRLGEGGFTYTPTKEGNYLILTKEVYDSIKNNIEQNPWLLLSLLEE